ncbi:MAG: DUF1353 domain-containing protein, partial [Geminicoccaceae bacterium]
QYDRPPEPDSGHWQLIADYRMIFRPPGGGNLWTVTAPRGMMTDLASIPRFLWDVEGLAPFGPHSGPSVIHDYLFMCWNAWPLEVLPKLEYTALLRQRFDFANLVFWWGLLHKKVELRRKMWRSVDVFGWPIFEDNPEPFVDAMARWEKWL